MMGKPTRTKSSKPRKVCRMVADGHSVRIGDNAEAVYRAICRGAPACGRAPAGFVDSRGATVDADALFEFDGRGDLVFGIGIAARVATILLRQGYVVEPVQVNSHHYRPSFHPNLLPPPDASWLSAAGDEAKAFADALSQTHRGLIATSSEAQKIDCVVEAASAFPSARITVAVASRLRAEVLAETLQRRVGRTVGLAHLGGVPLDSRLNVCTLRCLRPDYTELILLDDAATALHVEGARLLDEHGWRSAFGFLDPREYLSPLNRCRLEAVLGSVVYEVPDRRVKVRVGLVDGPKVPPALGPSALDRKRNAIWNHGERNRRIADVASSLAADHAITRDAGKSGGVVVLVESPEHARRLKEFLPGWKIRSDRQPGSSRESNQGHS